MVPQHDANEFWATSPVMVGGRMRPLKWVRLYRRAFHLSEGFISLPELRMREGDPLRMLEGSPFH